MSAHWRGLGLAMKHSSRQYATGHSGGENLILKQAWVTF